MAAPLYSDDELMAELRRIAAQLRDEPVIAARVAELSAISPHTFRRRFGSWRQALEAGGLGARYSGRRVTPKMQRPNARMTNQEVLDRMRSIAAGRGRSWIRKSDVHQSDELGLGVVLSAFETWPAAVAAAGLSQAPQVTRPAELRKVTDAELIDNLRDIAEELRRLPRTRELKAPLSRFSYHVYLRRFGSWAAVVDAWHNDQRREPGAGT